MKCTVVKKSAKPRMGAQPAKAVKGDAPPDAMLLTDNEDGTFTINGVDARGNQIDISGVATLAASGDNTSLLTVDAPAGMIVTTHALAAGDCNVNVTATWNDGSIGPFSLLILAHIDPAPPGPVVGLVAKFGTPTVRP